MLSYFLCSSLNVRGLLQCMPVSDNLSHKFTELTAGSQQGQIKENSWQITKGYYSLAKIAPSVCKRVLFENIKK